MADPRSLPGTILPDRGLDPLEVSMKRKGVEDQFKADQQKQAAMEKAARAKNAKITLPTEVWSNDYTYIQDAAKNLNDFVAKSYDDGLDPDDLTSDAGRTKAMMEAQLMQQAGITKADEEYYTGLLSKINSPDATKFVPGALEAVNQWKSLPLNERMKVPRPTLESLYDLAGQTDNYMKNIKADVMARAGMGETMISKTTVESLPETALVEAGDAHWTNDPYMKSEMAKQFANLPDNEQIQVMAKAKQAGIDPGQQMARNWYLSKQYRKEDKSVSERSAGSMGYAANKKAAEYFVDLAKGVDSGTFSGFKDAAKDGQDLTWELFPKQVGKIPEGRFSVAAAPPGVLMSPKTHKSSERVPILDDKGEPTGDFTGETNVTEIKDELKGFIRRSDGKIAILTTFNDYDSPNDIPEAEWIDKGAFKDKLLIPVAMTNKDVPLGQMLNAAEQKGEKWAGTGTFKDKNGDVISGSGSPTGGRVR